MTGLVQPALLSAAFDTGVFTYRLTLVRTLSADEGSALLERVEGRELDYVEHGCWSVKRSGDGPATLSLDMELDGADDEVEAARAVAQLIKQLVADGAAWGIEAGEDW